MKVCHYILITFLLLPGISASQSSLIRATSYSQSPRGIWTLDWSPDDKYVALGGDDSLLRIYDARSWKLFRVYKARHMIRQVKWSSDNKWLAVSGAFNSVDILDLQTDETRQFLGLEHGARGIAWNYNNELIAAADGAGVVRIWNMEGKLLRSITKPDRKSYLSIDWHPDKNMLAVSGDDIRIMDTAGNTLHVIRHRKEATGILTTRWHPSGRFLSSGDYGHHNEGIPSLIQFWTPEGKLIKTLISSKKEYRILSWNLHGTQLAASGDALHIYSSDGAYLKKSIPLNGVIWGLDWDRSEKRVIAAEFDGTVKLYDRNARLLRTIHP
jgi:WD40 repeat protein